MAIGGGHIERYISDNPAFELVESTSDRSSVDRIIKAGIDCLFICTPNDSHYDYAKAAIENHINVFCEKPLCTDADKEEQLIEIAEKNDVVLYVDYIYQCSRSIQYLKKLVAKFGNPILVRGFMSQYGRFYKKTSVFDNIGLHLISMIAYILDVYEKESFRILHNRVFRTKENDNGIFQYTELLVNNTSCVLDCLLTSLEKRRYLEIVWPEAVAVFDPSCNMGSVRVKEIPIGMAENGAEEMIKNFDEKNNIGITLDVFHRLTSGNALELKNDGFRSCEEIKHTNVKTTRLIGSLRNCLCHDTHNCCDISLMQ